MSQRHQLIYLNSHSPFKLISQHQDNVMINHAVKTWINQGFPVIFARQDEDNKRYTDVDSRCEAEIVGASLVSARVGSAQDQPVYPNLHHQVQKVSIKLGLPLLINHLVYRVTIMVDKSSIEKISDLPLLALSIENNNRHCEHSEAIQKSKQNSLDCFVRLRLPRNDSRFAALAMTSRGAHSFTPTENFEQLRLDKFIPEPIYVYGSFLWQHITQQAYVKENSDLDILINYQGSSLSSLKQHITVLQAQTGRVIDGEIRFNDIGDIALKELINSNTPEVLVKTVNTIYLMPRSKLYEHYPSLSQ